MKWRLIWMVVILTAIFFLYSGYRTFGLIELITAIILSLLITAGALFINYIFEQ